RQAVGTRAGDGLGRRILPVPCRGPQARPPFDPWTRGESRSRTVRAMETRDFSGSGRKATLLSRAFLHVRGRPRDVWVFALRCTQPTAAPRLVVRAVGYGGDW